MQEFCCVLRIKFNNWCEFALEAPYIKVIVMDIKGLFSPLKWKEKLENYRRVIAVSRKPDKEEFLSTARITALGIAIVGTIGFVVYMIYYLLQPLIG